jgi:hypothetical protein
MTEQEQLDIEIKKMRIDYDISAYRTQILDQKRKLLEASKLVAGAKATIVDLEDKIAAKELEKEAL